MLYPKFKRIPEGKRTAGDFMFLWKKYDFKNRSASTAFIIQSASFWRALIRLLIFPLPKIFETWYYLGFWETFFSGHVSIGRRVTIFGSNAMHWSLCIYDTKWGHLHFDLPTLNRLLGKKTWCCYASPNCTPWACTWYIGSKDPKEKIRAQIRRLHFGHNFKITSGTYADSNLYKLNNDMDVLLWGYSYKSA